MDNSIKLSLAHMGGREQYWIDQAFKTGWIVPLGPNVDEFERLLGEYLGTPGRVVALSAGTAALHLGLVMLGVAPGDEVVCQSFTFSASANPVKYMGANPVFVGSERDTWNMDPAVLDNCIAERVAKTGRKPKAIIPVHLYGMPAKMKEILAVADKWEIPVLEDAAEALGSELYGHKCGTFGRFAALSFNGNKIITTSGGGALVCPDAESAARVKFYATQARENRPYYYHEVIGYNYRLSNVCAGIGVGQMEVLDAHIERRREIHGLYRQLLSEASWVKVMDNPSDNFASNFWLSTITIDPECGCTPDELRLFLAQREIESRLLWRPMHMQPIFADAPYYDAGDVEKQLFDTGLCLPSGSGLSDEQIERVARAIIDFGGK